MKRYKRYTTGLLSILTAGILAVSPVFGAQGTISSGQGAGMDQLAGDKGVQLSVRDLDDVLQEEGLTWKEWNETVQAKKKAASLMTISGPELLEADPSVKILEEDGTVYMISGQALPYMITNMEDACEMLYRLLPLLGREGNENFIPTLRIRRGEDHIYLFREAAEGNMVFGSTVRLITDASGRLKAVFQSLPDEEDFLLQGTGEVTAEEAEASVKAYMEQNGLKGEILGDYTSRIIVPQDGDDLEENYFFSEEELPDELLWAVYSEDPDGGFLAHYLSADGTYRDHQNVKTPGDEAGQSGYDAACFFDGMEADEWTGDVTYQDGRTETITIPVMKDPETGTVYLGDVERRIVIAEFQDYILGDKEVVMVSSEGDHSWNDDDVITYANFLTVWDAYASMGWKSGDGQGTPTLLLRGMTTEDGQPMDNAAYGTKFKGWLLFVYDNSLTNFDEALDVWAHEFTHCLTHTLQGDTRYENDQGAINESMSDILGNLLEMIIEDQSDPMWLIGEDTMMAIRSMMDPHAFEQPEYVWDLFYGRPTSRPNDINDQGGVHYNSSILNRIAARMCLEESMPLETALDFWIRTACCLTPGTDLPQMAEVLPWVAQEDDTLLVWKEALERMISEGCLTRTHLPDELEEGRKLVSVVLPDTPAMSDDYWILQAVQLNTDSLLELLFKGALSMLAEGAAEPEENSAEAADGDEDALSSFISSFQSWTNGEDSTITVLMEDKPAFYLLMNIDPNTLGLRGMAVYFHGKWIDLSSQAKDLGLFDMGSPEADSVEETLEEGVEGLLSLGWDFLEKLLEEDDAGEVLREGYVEILPSNGLELVELAQ